MVRAASLVVEYWPSWPARVALAGLALLFGCAFTGFRLCNHAPRKLTIDVDDILDRSDCDIANRNRTKANGRAYDARCANPLGESCGDSHRCDLHGESCPPWNIGRWFSLAGRGRIHSRRGC